MDPLGPKDPWTDWLVLLILCIPLGYVMYLVATVLWFKAVT